MKIAFTGSSGSGKTTLVKFVSETLGIKHISGSAGDLYTETDKIHLNQFNFDTHLKNKGGHLGVIKKSAVNWNYGFTNQMILLDRRGELISNNENFVTDRSPVDNFTYFVNQVGYHTEVNNDLVSEFFRACFLQYNKLTHLVYIKAVQPYGSGIENNGSRIHNWWYQKAIDAQFHYWLKQMAGVVNDEELVKPKLVGPQILLINYWDLEKRKTELLKFLK